jgi:hypothetical protein
MIFYHIIVFSLSTIPNNGSLILFLVIIKQIVQDCIGLLGERIKMWYYGQLLLRASASHCQIDCQISFDNYHLNFNDAETKQN